MTVETKGPAGTTPLYFQRQSVFVTTCLMVVGMLFAAYSNHFDKAFHFDDSHVIVDNLYIRSLSQIPRFFTDAMTFSSLPLNATYRPLLTTSFAIDYWLAGGLDPWQFHVTQFLMLVSLGAAATYLFLRVMNEADPRWWNRYLALFTTTLFCVHTANTETVNYISTRSELLSTLAVVLAFCTYFAAPRGSRGYWCIIPMAVGALAKSPAVIFAPLLAGYVLLFEQRLSGPGLLTRAARPRLRAALDSTLPVLAAGVAMFLFVESMNSPTQTYSQHSRLAYMITQPFVWVHYLREFFIPLGLTADTDWSVLPHWYDTRLFGGMLGIGLLAWLGWRASTKRLTRPVAFGLFWFAAALAPDSSIFPLSEVANGHRGFFPYLGLALAVVWGARVVAGQWFGALPRIVAGGIAGFLMVTVLTANVYATRVRNRVWLSDESLWSDVVEKSPNNGRAWMNYGLSQMSRGRYDRAKELFDRAAVLSPNYSVLETNLAIVTDRLGDPVAAEGHFRRALELTPEYAAGQYFFASWLVQQARAPEAILLLERAVQITPGYSLPRTMLMNLHYAKGDDLSLRAMVESTMAVSPQDPVATEYARGGTPVTDSSDDGEGHWDRGVAMTNQGRHLDAALAYRHILRIGQRAGPTGLTGAALPDVWNNLGWSLGQLGFYEEAVPAFERALGLRPGHELAVNNLAWAQGQR